MSSSTISQEAKGSKKWLRVLINDYPEILARELRPHIGLASDSLIQWASPLKEDKYLEYRDGKFLKMLDTPLEQHSLTSFWPARGARWDALGRTEANDLLLVEAKAHTNELASTACDAGDERLAKIRESLDETQHFLGGDSQVDWTTTHYQYANRLAHLYLLRQLNELPAYLVYIYFINATDMRGPTTQREWESAIARMQTRLGLREHRLSPYICQIFIDVTELHAKSLDMQ